MMMMMMVMSCRDSYTSFQISGFFFSIVHNNRHALETEILGSYFEDSKFVSSAKGHAQWEWELENHHRIELCLGASICISNFSFAYNWGADRMNE